MPHTLHIIEPEAPACRPAALALLADLTDDASEIVLFGGRTAEDLAIRLGVATHDRLPRSAGRLRPGLPPKAFKRYLDAAGPFDLIQIWSPRLLPVTLAAAPAHVPLIVMLTLPPASPQAGRWMTILLREAANGDRRRRGDGGRGSSGSSNGDTSLGRIRLCAFSHTIAAAWCAAGVRPDFVEVIAPGLRLGRLQHADRDAIRQRWGITSGSRADVSNGRTHDSPGTEAAALGMDQPFVVGIPMPPDGRPIDAARLGRLVALLRLSGIEVIFVTGPRLWRADLGVTLSRITPRSALGPPGHEGPARPVPIEPRTLDLLTPELIRARRCHDTEGRVTGYGVPHLLIEPRVDEPWQIWSACDAILIIGDDRAMLHDVPALTPRTADAGTTRPDAAEGNAVSASRSDAPSKGRRATRARWGRRGRRSWWRPRDPLGPGPQHEAGPPDSLALNWAMASGRPIIAEASHAATEWITPDVTGLIVPPGDDDYIVQRLRMLIEDGRRCWQLGDAARAEAFKVLSRQAMRSGLSELRRSLCGEDTFSDSVESGRRTSATVSTTTTPTGDGPDNRR